MALPNVTHEVSQEVNTSYNTPARIAPCNSKVAIQSIYEKMGFRALEGWSEFEEEWESPTVLVLTGTMEMWGSNGSVLKAPCSCRIEFGKYSLEIGNMKPTGQAA